MLLPAATVLRLCDSLLGRAVSDGFGPAGEYDRSHDRNQNQDRSDFKGQ